MEEHFERNKVKVAKVNVKASISRTMESGEVFTIVRAVLWKAAKAVMEDLCGEQGYTITIRQLHYQLVGADIIRNDPAVYQLLIKEMVTMRKVGFIDWGYIEDRTRDSRKPYHEIGVGESLERTLQSFRLDRQIGQRMHIEVMMEKDAVSNFVVPVCERYGIQYTVNKGYLSKSAAYSLYKRVVNKLNVGQPVRIIYLADHDPSGMNMRGNIMEELCDMIFSGSRMRMENVDFSADVLQEMSDFLNFEFMDSVYHDQVADDFGIRSGYYEDLVSEKFLKRFKFVHEGDAVMAAMVLGGMLKVDSVALNMDQIREFKLPPNFAKEQDPRFKKYRELYGAKSWELDALSPGEMREILVNGILKYLDMDAYEKVMEEEERQRVELRKIVNQF